VFLMRTVRLPDAAQGEARQRALLSEIRRTVAAARQQLTDGQVDQVVVCGNRYAADQAKELADELDIPVAMLDPAGSAPDGLTSQPVPAESLARFAAVLGMALNEADRRPPIVDFANVRRRAEPRRFDRVHALAAAAAAIAVLGLAGHLWLKSNGVAKELAEVRNEIQMLQGSKDQYAKVTEKADAVERWLATDVNWLDELEQFARRVRPQPLSAKDYPVNDDVVVTQLTMVRPPGTDAHGGRMDLRAVAKNESAVLGLHQRLSDDQHRVVGGGGEQDSSVAGYNWLFGLEVHVEPEDLVEATP
jgi:hypothetical protein